VWGSEFISKDATLQEGSSRNRCWAERKIVGSGGGGGGGGGGGELPLFWNSRAHKNLKFCLAI
jgi:hypothetical protein